METLHKLMTEFHINAIFHAVLILGIGFFVSRIISVSANRILRKHLRLHQVVLLRRILFYLIFILFAASAIQQLGFNISALLGATGILTVALGIASQTSMSNVVSGMFIIGEKPFEMGDVIKVNDVQGEVLSIDFLSVKIRAANNTMIRIPNEILIKSAITNFSYFPERRIELTIGLNLKEDLEHIKQILLSVCQQNTLCLNDPAPTMTIENINDATATIKLSTWAKTPQHDQAKSMLQAEIKLAFAKQNIDIPGMSRTLFLDSSQSPLAIKIISEAPSSV